MSGKVTSSELASKNERNDADVADPYELPVDRGWAWCILVSTFVGSMLSIGYFRSFGILFVEFLNRYQEPASVTSLIMGIQAATISISGFLTHTILITKFKVRTLVTFGGVVMANGIILSVFANSIPALIITQSIMFGGGIPMVVGGGIIMLNSYFNKRRALALAVSGIGANIGAIVFPPFVRYQLNEYGIGGTFLITGATVLHVIPFGMLLRPFSVYERLQKQKKHLANSLLHDYQANSLNSVDLLPHKADNNIASDFRDRAYSDSFGLKKRTDYTMYCSSPDLVAPFVPNVYQSNDMESDKDSTKLDESDVNLCKKYVNAFNFSLVKNPLFLIIIGTSMFGIHACATMNIYIPALAKSKNVSKSNAALLLSIVAATGIFSRLLVGVLSDSNIIKRAHIMSLSLALTGISGLCAPLYDGFGAMVAFSVIYGFFGGLHFVLMSALMVDFLGIERLSTCYGFMQLVNGASMAIIHPIAGWIKDETGTFDRSYQMFGCSAMIAAGILLLEPLARTSKHTPSKKDVH